MRVDVAFDFIYCSLDRRYHLQSRPPKRHLRIIALPSHFRGLLYDLGHFVLFATLMRTHTITSTAIRIPIILKIGVKRYTKNSPHHCRRSIKYQNPLLEGRFL